MTFRINPGNQAALGILDLMQREALCFNCFDKNGSLALKPFSFSHHQPHDQA